MSYMAYDNIAITVAVIAAALAFVVLVFNASKAIREWRTIAKKPTEDKIADHEQRISKLEECCDEVKGKLASDWQWQQDATEMNQLMLKSIKRLLQHAVDGNDTSKLMEMEQEIDDYLLKHQR